MTQDRISGNTIFEHTLCFGHVFRKILFQLSNCHKRKRKIDCVSCGRETMGTYVKVFYIKQYTKMETGWYDFHSTQIATQNKKKIDIHFEQIVSKRSMLANNSKIEAIYSLNFVSFILQNAYLKNKTNYKLRLYWILLEKSKSWYRRKFVLEYCVYIYFS